MFDRLLRPVIDPPLNHLGRRMAQAGIRANQVTLAGLGLGLGAALAILAGWLGLALLLILFSRLADGLDGAIARATAKTPFGGYLDILCDFAFYAAIPLAFGLSVPGAQAPALVLLASFILSGVSFLAAAILAASQGWETSAQGEKSFYYLAGLAEGSETILVFCAFCLFPQWFGVIAYAFAVLCVLTAFGRTIDLYRRLGGGL
jgi:phosphatidylglycerophosphate synthase